MNIQIFDIYLLLLATPKQLFQVTKMISAIICLPNILPYNQIIKRNNQIIETNSQIFKITIVSICPEVIKHWQ